VLVVAGGVLLLRERERPPHVRTIGLLFALLATVAFATRDSLIRWLGTKATDVPPGTAALATMLSASVVVLGFAIARRTPIRLNALPRFVPAGLCNGVSYVCLFEAYYRGRVSVVSPLIATETLWAVALSVLVLHRTELVGRRLVLGTMLVVTGGALIGVFR